MNGTMVYVLGAGCSVRCGYPLGAGFVPALEDFSRCLGNDAQKLKRCIRETAALMREVNAQTMDEFVHRIYNRALDDPGLSSTDAYGVQLQRIRKAKIATAALFLKLEQATKPETLAGYQRLILRMFPGPGMWQQRIGNGNCRLLTFNYDRQFELTLLRTFGIDAHRENIYHQSILNSGLTDITGRVMEFTGDRFCYLKLHGSIGPGIQEQSGPRYNLYRHGAPGDAVAINDELFFAHENPQSPLPTDFQPLIVFPFEKDFIRSGADNQLPFRNYIESVWQQAERVVASASHIRFIGYSFHPMDHGSVINLLKKAEDCPKIIIQDRPGEAERICARLKNDYPELPISFEAYGCEF